MSLMPITDSLFLDAETRERPMHVGGLQVYSPPEDAGEDYVGRLYREAVTSTEVSKILTRRPARMGAVGPWTWEEDPDTDLEYHIRHSALPHPGRIRELLALTSRLHGTMLHRSRPLWEAHLIEGLADGRFAAYTKMHHALVDGVTSMRLLMQALSTDPDERDAPPPWSRMDQRPRSEPSDKTAEGVKDGISALWSAATSVAGKVGDVVSGAAEGMKAVAGSSEAAVKNLWKAINDEAAAFPYKAPRSILNVPITGARRFAADGFGLDRIKAIRQASGATLNDVVMAICSGALRDYLIELDALPDAPLVAAVPVSLHKEGEGAGGNAVGIVLCNLGTHLSDPMARFELVRESMEQGKLSMQGLSQAGVLLLSAMSFGPLAFGPLFRFESMRRPPFNVIISNVPGPRQHLYYNGARLDGLYPVSIPTDGQALNITVTSYVDQLQVGLTGCRRSLPHLQRLLTHMEDALSELEKAV